jgi:hypothetical protein
VDDLFHGQGAVEGLEQGGEVVRGQRVCRCSSAVGDEAIPHICASQGAAGVVVEAFELDEQFASAKQVSVMLVRLGDVLVEFLLNVLEVGLGFGGQVFLVVAGELSADVVPSQDITGSSASDITALRVGFTLSHRGPGLGEADRRPSRTPNSASRTREYLSGSHRVRARVRIVPHNR